MNKLVKLLFVSLFVGSLAGCVMYPDGGGFGPGPAPHIGGVPMHMPAPHP